MISFDNIISSDTIPFEIVPQLSDQQIKIGQVELIIGDKKIEIPARLVLVIGKEKPVIQIR